MHLHKGCCENLKLIKKIVIQEVPQEDSQVRKANIREQQKHLVFIHCKEWYFGAIVDSSMKYSRARQICTPSASKFKRLI